MPQKLQKYIFDQLYWVKCCHFQKKKKIVYYQQKATIFSHFFFSSFTFPPQHYYHLNTHKNTNMLISKHRQFTIKNLLLFTLLLAFCFPLPSSPSPSKRWKALQHHRNLKNDTQLQQYTDNQPNGNKMAATEKIYEQKTETRW